MKKKLPNKKISLAICVCLLLTSGLLWLPVRGQASTATFGNDSIGQSVFYFRDYKAATKFQLNQDGIVYSITAYFENTLFNAKLGIYSDENGQPKNLIAQSKEDYIQSKGWHEFPVPSTQLLSGYYWLSIITDGKEAAGRLVSSNSVQTTLRLANYPTEFLASFGIGGWDYSIAMCIYAKCFLTQIPSPHEPTPEPTPLPTPDPTPTPIPSPSASKVFGNDAVGNSVFYIRNYKVASKFQLNDDANIQSINFYFSNAGFYAKAAVYSDSSGRPLLLLTQSKSDGITSSGWHEFTVSQTSLVTGSYWLCIITDDVNAQGRMISSENPSQSCVVQSSYPSEFLAALSSDPAYYSLTVSIYAKYIASSASEPPPPPTPPVPPTPAPQLSWEMYSDQACTNKVSSLNWGVIAPGALKSMVITVRNEGNVPITLTKTMTNLNPSNLATHMTLNWDYGNQSLNPNETLKLALTLYVSESITGISSFSFDTAITATS